MRAREENFCLIKNNLNYSYFRFLGSYYFSATAKTKTECLSTHKREHSGVVSISEAMLRGRVIMFNRSFAHKPNMCYAAWLLTILILSVVRP